MLVSTTSAAAAGGGAKLAQKLLRIAAHAASNSSNGSSSSSGGSDESGGSRHGKHSSSRKLWRKIPVPIPDTTPWEASPDSPAAADDRSDSNDASGGQAADGSSHWIPQGSEVSASCLRYHVREFLSALLVLLRLAPLRRGGLLEAAALQEVHYSVLHVSRIDVTLYCVKVSERAAEAARFSRHKAVKVFRKCQSQHLSGFCAPNEFCSSTPPGLICYCC
jgi:hypothetical protein